MFKRMLGGRPQLNSPDLFGSIVLGLCTFRSDSIPDLVCNASTCRPRAKNHQPHVSQLELANVQACHYSCESYATGPLHVVVKACDLRTVFIKDTPCIGQTKVFTVE